MNVLISSAGRRVALVQIFRDALSRIAPGSRVVAADMTRYASAFHAADDAFLVPRCTSPDFIPTVIDACRRREIGLIVPTIDPELPVYANAREELRAAGIEVSVPGPLTVRIGGDKVHTHAWLTAQGLPTVRQQLASAPLPEDWAFPCIVKPRAGSSAIGVSLVRSREDFARLSPGPDDLVQELAPGVEYTIDFWVDRSGRCRCAVPRRRLEVRAGEVSKAVTHRDADLEALAFELAARLPDAFGVLNVQVFHDESSGRLSVIELNPRFGGGFPLSWEAGARMAEWLLRDLLGLPQPPDAELNGWKSGLVMLRYDAAVFVEEAGLE